jgi:hypothetical protein
MTHPVDPEARAAVSAAEFDRIVDPRDMLKPYGATETDERRPRT